MRTIVETVVEAIRESAQQWLRAVRGSGGRAGRYVRFLLDRSAAAQAVYRVAKSLVSIVVDIALHECVAVFHFGISH